MCIVLEQQSHRAFPLKPIVRRICIREAVEAVESHNDRDSPVSCVQRRTFPCPENCSLVKRGLPAFRWPPPGTPARRGMSEQKSFRHWWPNVRYGGNQLCKNRKLSSLRNITILTNLVSSRTSSFLDATALSCNAKLSHWLAS